MTLVRVKTVTISDLIAERAISVLEAHPRARATLTQGSFHLNIFNCQRLRIYFAKFINFHFPMFLGTSLIVVFQSENGCEVMRNTLESYSSPSAILMTGNGVQTTELCDLLLPLRGTATLDSCTCCVVKPHAVKGKSVGGILDIIIQQGYEISAVDSFQFDKQQSEEFLEIYKGVLPDVADHIVQLSSGLSVCLELRAENAVEVQTPKQNYILLH